MSSENVRQRKGSLVLIGGNEEKSGVMTILRRVLSQNQARRVVVIPTASDFPHEMTDRYVPAFRELGAEDVAVLNIRDRGEAEKPVHAEAVRQADVVFFTGGDQVKLVAILENTPLIREIRARFAQGMTIAGTSAGASAAGEVMIFSGDDRGTIKGAVENTPGFGFIRGLIFDTHFLMRGRITRLIQAVASGLGRRAVGLAEDSAVVIDPRGILEVVGSGPAILLDGEAMLFTDYESVQDSEPISVDRIPMSCLSPGTLFDLTAWRVVPGGDRREASPRSSNSAQISWGRYNT